MWGCFVSVAGTVSILCSLAGQYGNSAEQATLTEVRLKSQAGKGALRQVFIRVYRLEIQSVMLVFSTHLCELLPL
jgi:hypothetical protein